MRAPFVILLAALRCGARQPPAGKAFLTIELRLPPGCAPGMFFVDGQAIGHYPVSQAVVPAGCHVVHLESAGDCAGYGEVAIDFAAGGEHHLGPDEVRALGFQHASCP